MALSKGRPACARVLYLVDGLDCYMVKAGCQGVVRSAVHFPKIVRAVNMTETEALKSVMSWVKGLY